MKAHPPHIEDIARPPRSAWGLVLRGFCMGAADIVPGVSGGTMAFILGIYEELVEAIRAIGSRRFWRAIATLHVGEACRIVHAGFLLAILGGILLAIVLLSRPLAFLLDEQPMLLWSFFFGLVTASVIEIARRIRRWNGALVAALCGGAAAAYVLVGLVPVQTPQAPWFLMLSGAVAVCAMILPGISGAFFLVLLGKYAFVLEAVNNRDFLPLGYVAAGAVIGLILFSQLLSWLLHRWHDRTVTVLTGLMLGSLRELWPWQTEGGATRNVLPSSGEELLTGLLLIAAGAAVVLLLERWAARNGKS